MNITSRLSEFLDLIDSARTMGDLTAKTLTVIEHFRLSAVASGIIVGSKAATAERFHFAHWPKGFMDRYIAEDLQAIDPIPRWARRAGVPATFREITQRLPVKDPGHKAVKVAKDFGCIEGICMPMRAADGAIGLCSVVGDRPRFKAEEFRDLVAIGSWVFRRAEHLDRSVEKAQGAPILTSREIDLLSLLVHGHSDREIAALSAISETTVRFHFKNVRGKIGAVSRTHLAAKVVALGFVTL